MSFARKQEDELPDHITPKWVKEAIFYQIFPDRFAKSGLNDKLINIEAWNALPTYTGYKGGDFQGIINNIDYLVELGVTALYFNPIFSSTANHRYHTSDYFTVDPLLGGNAAFQKFLELAHDKGLKVILDGVFNHTGRGFYQFTQTLENRCSSPYLDWFHFNQEWLESGKPFTPYIESPIIHKDPDVHGSFYKHGYDAWWDLPALPKLNTDNPAVREFIFEVAEYWIKLGVDGWRLDVPSEIDDDAFWQEFRQRVKAINPEAYICGEIWTDAQRWLQGDQFDAVMNYPISRAIMGYFLAETLNHEQIKICGLDNISALDDASFASSIQHVFSLYQNEINQSQLNLLGSHDTPRLLNMASGDKNGVKLCFVALMTFVGAPCIYYGDEVGMAGNHDPDCRRGFEWDEKLWDHELHSLIKSLISLRKEYPCLSRGEFRIIHAIDGTFAYSRLLEEQEIIVIFNRSHHEQDIKIYPKEHFLQGQSYQSYFDSKEYTVSDVLPLKMKARSFDILLKQ